MHDILAASQGRPVMESRVRSLKAEIVAGDPLAAILDRIVEAETPKANSTVRRMARLAREARDLLGVVE